MCDSVPKCLHNLQPRPQTSSVLIYKEKKKISIYNFSTFINLRITEKIV